MMRDERNEEIPPHSRLFIVCSKQLKAEDLRPHFEKYGDIEELHMPRDRNSGESKGIAYIKYTKTSSAAAAIESLHMKRLQEGIKPIKVIIACNKNDEKNENDTNRHKRLFIKVSKETTESDIQNHFNKFGKTEYVRILRDRDTNECRGLAFINYGTFMEAATAYEQCDRKYKPMFATPRDNLKRTRMNFERAEGLSPNTFVDAPHTFDSRSSNGSILPLITTEGRDFDTIEMFCHAVMAQKPIERLFNIIPGMIQFKFMIDGFSGATKAVIKYDTKVAAAHALLSLNNYEFPSGEIIMVKPVENTLNKVANNLTNIVNNFKNSCDPQSDLMQLADAIAQASSVIKAATSGGSAADSKAENLIDNFCSVRLPPPKPMASNDSIVAKRCFLVFKPHSLPVKMLQDVFCRFGDLIEVTSFPHKTFGFVKFASVQSADNAMNTLHGAVVHGIRLKVLEAEDKPNKGDKMAVDDDDDDNDHKDLKRPRLDRM